MKISTVAESAGVPWFLSTPGHATIRDMAGAFRGSARRLAPDVLLAQVVAVVGEDEDGGKPFHSAAVECA